MREAGRRSCGVLSESLNICEVYVKAGMMRMLAWLGSRMSYSGLKVAKDAGRDSIWKFILQNTYKPVFLKNKFDLVVGNPPWLTYAGIWKDHPDFDAVMENIAEYGRTVK